jgi:hypothetical protein
MARFMRAHGFPSVVEHAFREKWPLFSEQAIEDRFALTSLICSAYQYGKYAHRFFDGFISLSYQSRDKMFGRGGFQALNDKLGLFEVREQWRKNSHTKGYRLVPEALSVLEGTPRRTTEIVDLTGASVKVPAKKAIFSRDSKGNSRKGVGQMPAVIPVNIDAMHELLMEAWQWRRHYQDGQSRPEGRRLESRMSGLGDDRSRVIWLSDHLIAPLTLAILRSDTVFAPRGFMELTYVEASNGRLYAVGGSLQNAPRDVRKAALSGAWDYDIENCHYTLLAQLAKRVGLKTPAIEDYLARKKEVRESLARDVGIAVNDVKQALLASLYGAQRRLKAFRTIEPAILTAVGEEKARMLFEHPLFAGLHEEGRRIRGPILESMPVNRGLLVNGFGKGIDAGESGDRKMAHVVQGCEAWILDVVLQAHGSALLLLMHDGFVSASRLDVAALADRVFRATGFRVKFDEVKL